MGNRVAAKELNHNPHFYLHGSLNATSSPSLPAETTREFSPGLCRFSLNLILHEKVLSFYVSTQLNYWFKFLVSIFAKSTLTESIYAKPLLNRFLATTVTQKGDENNEAISSRNLQGRHNPNWRRRRFSLPKMRSHNLAWRWNRNSFQNRQYQS